MVGVLLTAYLIIGIQVREKQEREKEILLKRQSFNAERLIRDIAASGEIVIQDDKVEISDLKMNECELVIRICYYNWKTEPTITFEQIKEQVYIYVESYEFDESTEELENFCAFVEEEGIFVEGANWDYEQYITGIDFALAEMKTDRKNATREQLEEACKKALEE